MSRIWIHLSPQFPFCCFKGNYFFAQAPGRSSRGNVDAEWHSGGVFRIRLGLYRPNRVSEVQVLTEPETEILPVPPSIRKSSPWLAMNLTHENPNPFFTTETQRDTSVLRREFKRCWSRLATTNKLGQGQRPCFHHRDTEITENANQIDSLKAWVKGFALAVGRNYQRTMIGAGGSGLCAGAVEAHAGSLSYIQTRAQDRTEDC